MLQIKSLTCQRGGREIFREIGFTLHAGEAMLVTGANGSGKSSLLRVLAGLLQPVEGAIEWRGQNIAGEPDAYRQSLHYIGHLDAVKHELTVGEMLDYWRALHCVQSCAIADPFDVSGQHNKPIRYLSAGQKRRLALSRLALGDAPLWLLDEPATALDREGQRILLECIAAHRAKGGIAVIAAHQDMNLPDTARYEMRGTRG